MDKIRFGVIGAGVYGEMHCRAIHQHPQAELVAVADIREDRAIQMAKLYGAGKFYKDYEEMLEESELDAVSIATPDHLHVNPCIAAVSRKKHIFVEKPLATNVKEAEAIVDAAGKANVELMIDFASRWRVPIARLKESIDSGEMGDLQYVYIRHSNTKFSPTKFLSWGAKTKVIWFLTIHSCDLLRWFFKDEPKWVFAVSKSGVLKKAGVDTPDIYVATVEFKGGGISVLESNWILPNTLPGSGFGKTKGLGVEFKIHVLGDRGAAYIDISPNDTIQKYTDEVLQWPDAMGTYRLHNKWAGHAISAMDHFIECLVEGRKPMVTPTDGLEAVKFVSAMDESARTKQPVFL